jgi:DNA-binding Lrp family transcriptional regulator
MRRPVPVPARARDYLLANPRQPRGEAAAALGVRPQTVTAYRTRLIAAGVLRREDVGLPPRDLTDALIARVELGEYLPLIAQSAGLTYEAALSRIHRTGARVGDLYDETVLSMGDLAAIFGYRSRRRGYDAILGWVRGGYIEALPRRAERGNARSPAPWRFTVDEVYRFLNNPDAWHLFRVGQITDPDWRAYAEDARNRAHLRPRDRRGRPTKLP